MQEHSQAAPPAGDAVSWLVAHHQVTYADFYEFYDGPEYRREQLAMYRTLAAEAGAEVLELGCGTGSVALDLARAGLTCMIATVQW